jgi:hypothetical protein
MHSSGSHIAPICCATTDIGLDVGLLLCVHKSLS